MPKRDDEWAREITRLIKDPVEREKWLSGRVLEELPKRKYPLEPPWKIWPEPSHVAWSIGSDADYFVEFREFFGTLSKDEKKAYIVDNPEPPEWLGYYDDV